MRARVGRHLRGSPHRRWHIDYLRAHAEPTALWLAPEGHLECVWAQHLATRPKTQIIAPRFGASDCRCPSHLFLLKSDVPTDLDLPGDPTLVSFSG